MRTLQRKNKSVTVLRPLELRFVGRFLASYQLGSTAVHMVSYNMCTQDGNCVVVPAKTTEFGFLGNFFVSRGETGSVLEIKAKRRTGEKNFISCMRDHLIATYPDKFLGMGGAFVVESGKVLVHTMVN